MHSFTVEQNIKITASTLLLTLKRDEDERHMAFQPGQYAAISFEHNGKKAAARCFSIVSSPTDQNILQFSTRVRGHYTKALANLQVGDPVSVYGPFGGFVFDVEKDSRAILIAGGIGITPFMSILSYLSRLGVNNDVTLLYGCQTQDDVPFADSLLKIQKEHPNIKIIFTISKGPMDLLPAQNVVAGSISEEVISKAAKGKFKDYKYFVCGSPSFMKSVVSVVTKKGVPKQQIMTEAFTQSSPRRQTSILRSWPANIYVLGVVGVVLGTVSVMVSDLLRALPPNTPFKPTANAPFLITNARQEKLDQLINSIPPSLNVITAPETPQQQTYTAAPAATNVQPAQTLNTPPPKFAPIYSAPRTTASTPPP